MKRTIGLHAPQRTRLALCLAAALGIGADRVHGAMPETAERIDALGTAVVTNCNDDGPGSLREAVGSASQIDLTQLTCRTIELTSHAIGLYSNGISLTGPGADRLTISAPPGDRVFDHLGSSTLYIEGLTIAGGSANGDGGCIRSNGSVTLESSIVTGCNATAVEPLGGGVYAANTLTAISSSIVGNTADGSDRSYGGGAFARHLISLYRSTVSDNVATGAFGNTGGVCSLASAAIFYSTISNNRATYNAGIAAFGEEVGATFTMNNSTVSGNIATLKVAGAGTLAPSTIVNSTIAFNESPSTDVGSGLFVHGEAHLTNTIVASNTAAVDLGGYSDAFVTGSHNLIGSSSVTLPADTIMRDPMLGPLADNGGTTMTHALLAGSPAIDAGTDATTFSMFYDQRLEGYGGILGHAPDIGAYEKQSTGVVRTVSSCEDSGAGSLRDEIAQATPGDTVDLRGLSCSTITLTTGAIEPTQSGLTVLGPGRDALTISGNDSNRIFDRAGATGTLLLSGLTLTHGDVLTNAEGEGGCVRSDGTLSLDRVAVSDCTARSATSNVFGGALFVWRLRMDQSRIENSHAAAAGNSYGGGVYAYEAKLFDSVVQGNSATPGSHSSLSHGGGLYVSGHAQISGSTVSANEADTGGGLYSRDSANVVNSTVSGNTAVIGGGMLVAAPLSVSSSTVAFNTNTGGYQVAAGVLGLGSVRLESTIAFGNVTAGTPYDVGISNGYLLVGSHNLVGAARITMPPDTIFGDPLLGPLQDNGGPTPTHAIGAGSPALDAGSNVLGLEHDQRGAGFVRVFGALPDIGAFEMQTVDTIFAGGFD